MTLRTPRATFVLALLLSLGMLVTGTLAAAEPYQSGLQPGDKLPGSFRPLNLTGPRAGEESCLVCEHGLNPVVMIFAREVSDPLTKLLVKVEEAATKNKAVELGTFAVFLSDKEALHTELPEVAKKSGLKELILSVDKPAGPEGYKVAKDADVIVVLYVGHVVKASHAFKKGDLNEKAVEKILADLPKITVKK